MNLYIINAQTSTTHVRYEKIGNVNHMVVPVVAVQEGVLNGLFVSSDEIHKSLPSWNGRPVTLDHMYSNGQPVSVNDPQYTNSTIGTLYNVEFVDNKMRGEMWINLEKAESLGGDALEVVNRFRNNQMVEVSTGFFSMYEDTQGTYNNVEYSQAASSLLPDHLAILLHTTGACSIADGCGAPRVNRKDNMKRENKPIQFLMTNQDFSHKETAHLLQIALDKLLDGRAYITYVFDTFFVYEKFEDDNWILFRLDFTLENESLQLGEEPTQVFAKTDFINIDDVIGEEMVTNKSIREIITNAISSIFQQERVTMDTQKIQQLTANCDCPFTAEELNKMPETAVDKLHDQYVVNRQQEEKETTPVDAVPAWAQQLAANVESVQKQIELVANEAISKKEAAKTAVIARLVANKKCPFDESELKTFSEDHLIKLEKSYATTNYRGLGLHTAPDGDELQPLTLNGVKREVKANG